MKTVNIVTPHFTPEITAAAHRLDAFVRTLSAEYRVHVFTLTEIGVKAPQKTVYLSDQVTVHYLDLPKYDKGNFLIRGIMEWIWSVRLVKKASQSESDVTIVTAPYMFLIVTAVLFGRGTPLIADVRDLVWCYLPEKNIFQRRIKKIFTNTISRFLARYNHILVTNPSEEEWILENTRVKNADISIISNGISKEKFDLITSIKYFQPDEPVTITYIGNIGNGQDLGQIIEVVKEMPDVKLNMIGEGIELEKFRKHIRSLGLRNIRLYGKLRWKRLLPFYQTSTILFARLGENYRSAIPSKIYEYLSTGLPVIFHGSGAAADFIKQFENTFLLESESPQDLKQLIRYITTIPLSRSFENILRMEDRFIRENINMGLFPVLAKVLNGIPEEIPVTAVQEIRFSEAY